MEAAAAKTAEDAVKVVKQAVNGVANGHKEAQPTVEVESTKPVNVEPAPIAKAEPLKVAQSEPRQIKDSEPVKPKVHAFKPELSDLPTPSANTLPSNRKRKTPNDFSPSGPNDIPTPSSPSKNSVKFEDGVAPGEGKGEKIIPVPKNRNAIERTIWTFIMIGGFITLLCLGHPYMILLVLLCQTLVYKEVTALFELRDQKKTAEDPWSKTLNW